MFLSREYHAHISESRFYPFLIALSAFGLMISALVPFEVVLIPAVAANPPKRAKKIWIAGVVGSALGATALAALFQYFGWPLVDRLIPTLAASRGWVIAQNWVLSYGALALVAIAALPIAQAPALVVVGLLQMPLPVVLVAFLFGKSAKYAVISALVLRSEARIKLLAVNGFESSQKFIHDEFEHWTRPRQLPRK